MTPFWLLLRLWAQIIRFEIMLPFMYALGLIEEFLDFCDEAADRLSSEIDALDEEDAHNG